MCSWILNAGSRVRSSQSVIPQQTGLNQGKNTRWGHLTNILAALKYNNVLNNKLNVLNTITLNDIDAIWKPLSIEGIKEPSSLLVFGSRMSK